MAGPEQTSSHRNLLLPSLERWPLDPAQPIIDLVDVSIGFDGQPVFDGLNLKIIPGLATVIVGRSGSGKSVLLKLMMGILRPDRGKVLLFGQDVASLTTLELLALRKRMGMLFQNYALFDAMSVEDNVGFTLLENSRLPRREIKRLSQELIAFLGLSGSEALLPGDLSGGMKKRVSLGRALIARPEVVLFDEPTTGLDPIMIEKVDEMLVTAKKEFQITSVIVSHDMASARRLADRVAFLHEGKVGLYDSFDDFVASDHPAVRKFLEGAGTSRLARAPAPESASVASVAAAPAEEFPVELVGVHKSFSGKKVLDGVDLAIPAKKITVVIGASGSGKSVIIKHILGLMRPDLGQVRVFGEDIGTLSARNLQRVRTRVGLLFQHAALLDWLTVYGNVAFPLQEHSSLTKSEIHERVQDVLERLHIADVAHRMPGEISVGQMKRTGLARAIVTKPAIMVYDEPTTGQDPVRTREIDDMIVETQEQFDITSIVISHDMASTFRIAHQIALLHQGRIAAFGTPAEVRASPDENVQHFIHAGSVDVG